MSYPKLWHNLSQLTGISFVTLHLFLPFLLCILSCSSCLLFGSSICIHLFTLGEDPTFKKNEDYNVAFLTISHCSSQWLNL